MRILRGVGSRILPCGCLIGLYETYDGRTVAMIDSCSPACTDGTHRINAAFPLPPQVPANNPPRPSA